MPSISLPVAVEHPADDLADRAGLLQRLQLGLR